MGSYNYNYLKRIGIYLLQLSSCCHALSSSNTAGTATASTSRQAAMERYRNWALEQPGVKQHPALIWKQQGGEEDWSLQLSEPVPHGTCLLELPYDILWRAKECPPIPPKAATILESCGYGKRNKENERENDASEGNNQKQDIHDGFRLYCKLLEEQEKGDASYWKVWLDAMPTSPSLIFSDAALAALPVQAQTMAFQVRQRCNIFAQAAVAAGYNHDTATAQAAALVYSRAWTAGDCDTMELVPIADMFNHHDDPANVQAEHAGGRVMRFRYIGNDSDDTEEKTPPRLGLSYGSPGHIHRLLVVFGFCDPSSIRRVSASLLLPPLPGMALDTIVMDRSAGIHDNVFYLIIDQLLATHRPAEHAAFRKAWVTATASQDSDDATDGQLQAQQHLQYELHRLRKPARQVLQQHLVGLVQELEALHPEAVAMANTFPMILVHNEFLTQTYRDTLHRLAGELETAGAREAEGGMEV